MKTIGVRMNPDLLRLVRLLTRDTGLTRSGVIKLALTELAARRGLRPGPEPGSYPKD